MNLLKFYAAVFFTVLSCYAFCQDKRVAIGIIKGRVISENGIPLAGASVRINNTTIGASTDKNGAFTLTAVPSNHIKIIASFIGYQVYIRNITANFIGKPLIIKLLPKDNQLNAVIIRTNEPDGWKKWGKVFTDNFIGATTYAKNCKIVNPEAIKFSLSPRKDQFTAYSNEPILVENNFLGYKLTIELQDFTYNFNRRDYLYEMYTFFEELPGTESQSVEWKKNRKEAFEGSLLHFMRSLYSNQFQKDGYQIHQMEIVPGKERQRIQQVLDKEHQKVGDSISSVSGSEKEIKKRIDDHINLDSLKYYQKVLAQGDSLDTIIHARPLSFRDIAKRKDDATVILDFQKYLHVMYLNKFEQDEYTKSKNAPLVSIRGKTTAPAKVKNAHPVSLLNLTMNIPVEVFSNGYFDNTDLMINGYWGWYENISTRLPYNYKP